MNRIKIKYFFFFNEINSETNHCGLIQQKFSKCSNINEVDFWSVEPFIDIDTDINFDLLRIKKKKKKIHVVEREPSFSFVVFNRGVQRLISFKKNCKLWHFNNWINSCLVCTGCSTRAGAEKAAVGRAGAHGGSASRGHE